MRKREDYEDFIKIYNAGDYWEPDIEPELPHTCPHCGWTVNNKADFTACFGWRNMGDGRIIEQSWCRIDR